MNAIFGLFTKKLSRRLSKSRIWICRSRTMSVVDWLFMSVITRVDPFMEDYLIVDTTLTCVVRLALTPAEDGNETSRSVCCEGLDQSHLVTVPAQGSHLWSTEITLLAHGSFG